MDPNEALELLNAAYWAADLNRGASHVQAQRRRGVMDMPTQDDALARWLNIETCSLLVSWRGRQTFDFKKVWTWDDFYTDVDILIRSSTRRSPIPCKVRTDWMTDVRSFWTAIVGWDPNGTSMMLWHSVASLYLSPGGWSVALVL